MHRIPPVCGRSAAAAELLAGRGQPVNRELDIVSALVETMTRLVVQELLEGRADGLLGGRVRY